MSKINNNSMIKINKVLENDFEIDMFSDYGIRKIVNLSGDYFLECNIYFNNQKDLIGQINLNKHIGSINSSGQYIMDMMVTEKHLYNECISKQNRRNINLLINESKKQYWVNLINKYKDEIKVN